MTQEKEPQPEYLEELPIGSKKLPPPAITDEATARVLAGLKNMKAPGRPLFLGIEEIRNRFGYHRPTSESQQIHTALRVLFRDFAMELDKLVPNGRAKSVAFTELENASMWSHKAVAQMAPVVEESAPTLPFAWGGYDPQMPIKPEELRRAPLLKIPPKEVEWDIDNNVPVVPIKPDPNLGQTIEQP